MVSALKSRMAGYVTNPNPAQIVTLFLSGLGALLLASMGIGWLTDTVGDSVSALCCALATWLCKWGPVLLAAPVRHFPFFCGALGVIWASYIARRVQKVYRNRPTWLDFVFFLLGLWTFICYYANTGPLLSGSHGFIYFLGLYSIIAVLAFCVMTLFLAVEEDASDDFSFAVVFIFAVFFGSIMTGVMANDSGDSEGLSILLGFVHFLANGLGIGVAFWFCSTADDMPE